MNMTLSKESQKKKLDIVDFAVNIEKAHQELVENCAFTKNSKPDVILDASIMVLSLLSYVNSKPAYQNIFGWIEHVFQYYIVDIIENESKLVKARYALMLGYLIDVLFKKDNNAFHNTIFFLYKSVDLQGEDKAIALQCIDTLKVVTCDQDLIPRVTLILPQLVQQIVMSIGSIQNHEYIEFV